MGFRSNGTTPARDALNTKTNHGGICLFYRTRYTVRRLKLPLFKSMEQMTVQIQGSSVNFVLVIVYRPDKRRPHRSSLMTFQTCQPCRAFGSLHGHGRRCRRYKLVYRGSLLTVYSQIPGRPRWCGSDPTRRRSTTSRGSHAGRCHLPATTRGKVHVEPPLISDHSLITAKFYVGARAKPRPKETTSSKRLWKELDVDAFRIDIVSSKLNTDPPPLPRRRVSIFQLVRFYDPYSRG